MKTEKPNIFITVSGLTPQIITESLYDFIIQKKFDIEEVHVLTTLRGKKENSRTAPGHWTGCSV